MRRCHPSLGQFRLHWALFLQPDPALWIDQPSLIAIYSPTSRERNPKHEYSYQSSRLDTQNAIEHWVNTRTGIDIDCVCDNGRRSFMCPLMAFEGLCPQPDDT